MTLYDILFYLFAGSGLAFGFLVVANPFSRNPVTSAMFLVLTIASLAGLFVLLGAFFLAAVQILVYAGAVIVLFLFVIMLLDLKEEALFKLRKATLALAAVAVGSLAFLFWSVIGDTEWGRALETSTVKGEGVKPLGNLLFREYLLPFEIVSVLLLVAMIGVVLLSKKDLR